MPSYARSGPASDAFAQGSAEGAVKLVAARMGKAPADLKVWIEHEDSAFGTYIATEQQRLLQEAGVTHVEVGADSARAVDLSDPILRAATSARTYGSAPPMSPTTTCCFRTARAGIQARRDDAGRHRRHL